MYAQMVTAETARTEAEMTPEERAFQGRIDADVQSAVASNVSGIAVQQEIAAHASTRQKQTESTPQFRTKTSLVENIE